MTVPAEVEPHSIIGGPTDRGARRIIHNRRGG